ncbi:MAG: polyphosphate kinase 1 [Fulvivirga sp.]|nr:polyphosphate kinase 1 [Fulvivirga sp.]
MNITPEYHDRDISWLSFNYRVLMEAADKNVPLYERIKFLAIYSSNLDEFFRVRVAALRSIVDIDKKKINKKFDRRPQEILDDILKEVNRQLEEFGIIKREMIIPSLKKNKIILYRSEPILEAHKEYVKHYFKSKVLSFLKPVIMTVTGSPTPYLDNRALYFAVDLKDGEQKQHYAHIKIPTDHLPRFIPLPSINNRYYFIAIDDIMRENMDFLFEDYTVNGSYSIKLNRDADLNIEDEFSGNLVKKITKQIEKRNLGVPSRFLYDRSMSGHMLNFLMESFKLRQADLVPGGRYHNMHDLMDLQNPISPQLENDWWPALNVPLLDRSNTIIEAIQKQDVMLHFPYQNYDYVLRYFNEAAVDVHVTAIKATFYRIAPDSLISSALISAAENGKDVTVFIEIKARFDEHNNLLWAEKMQQAGVKIIYSLPGLKVHAKVALIERTDPSGNIERFGFLGTGNFNEKTASIYADNALMTNHVEMTSELESLFSYLDKQNDPVQFNHLLVSQFNIVECLEILIDHEIKVAREGKKAHIILKLNNLQDDYMINKLYEASQAGVRIELIVRAICTLIPGIKGMSENISIRRIVDRYLEHSRVYYFHYGGKEKVYLGSADWMKRNLYRRIEVVFPLYDKAAQEEIKKMLEIQLDDNYKACIINDKLENIRIKSAKPVIQSQRAFHQWLKRKN